MRPLTPARLLSAALAEARVSAHGEIAHFLFEQVASLEAATATCISFLTDARYLKHARNSRAGAVLIQAELLAQITNPGFIAIVVDQPYLAFAKLSQWIAREIDIQRQANEGRESPSVVTSKGCWIHPTAILGRDVKLGPGVVIEAGSVIGDHANLHAHVVIGQDCIIGPRTQIFPQVVLYNDVVVGADCIIHSGTVLGSDGFGFAPSSKTWVKIAQLGAVRVSDNVEIGSNCSIDRGTLEDTVIESGCKLDNLIQVAHNVKIGEHCVLAACVGIAGSARLGKRCMIGGSVGILGHLSLCDDVTVTPMSLVMSSIEQPGTYSGSAPLMKHKDWEKSAAIVRNLPDFRSRLRALESLTTRAS